MAKHVCPVCEDVYAIPARVDVALASRPQRVDAWNCPRCRYEFVSVEDLDRLLRLAVPTGSVGPVEVTLLAEPEIVFRTAGVTSA
jgi:rubredoxin